MNISAVELSNVSTHGLWLLVDDRELHLPFDLFPWFREATPGNLGVFVLRQVEGELAHFRMISMWESRADIEAFAGDEIERARYYPEDADFLLELAPTVTHFEVLTGPEPAGGR